MRPKSASATAASCSIALHAEVAQGVPDWIQSDGGRVRQILYNLLGNALKFSTDTGRAGRVELRVRRCGPELPGHLEMSVVDNGIGMTPEALKRIFQPFVQAEGPTTRRFGGTGLGLSICKRLTSMMGGWIEAESVEDQGSCFKVTLPFEPAQAPKQIENDKPTITMSSGPRFALAGGPLVLVAEDNEINRKVIGHQLALLGVAAEMVDNGPDALARWRDGRASQRHAMLLTDLHMPGIDGYTLAATIRGEESDGSRLPILALSANALVGEIDRCRAAGIDDYLSKPVQTDQLGEMLKRWLPSEEVYRLESLDHVDCEEVDVFDVELGLCAYDDDALARLVGDDPDAPALASAWCCIRCRRSAP